MIFFPKLSLNPNPTAEELAKLGARLDTISALLQRHVDSHAELPAQVWQLILVESRAASAAAFAAAAASFRRHVWEEVSKWAWRVCLGYLGVQVLQYANTLATGLQHAGVGVTP